MSGNVRRSIVAAVGAMTGTGDTLESCPNRDSHTMRMNYAYVDHSHIVPRSYLDGFAVGRMVAMRLRGQATSTIISTRHAAVRKAFYRRTRLDGTPIDDIEWSLSEVENKTVPILRSVSENWPLAWEERAALAELFAFQLVRGPRWRNWHEDVTRQFIADYRDTPDGEVLPDAESDVATERLLGDTLRSTRMLSLGIKVTTIFASMHWTRLDFARPWLATSDQPVVPWPIGEHARRPQETPMDAGLMETLEVRVPVSPHCAIVMTWADQRDADWAMTRGIRDHAANLNAFTVAQAERQWFHLPDATVPVAAGRLVPLSPQLVPGYTAAAAASSRRRATTWNYLQTHLGQDLFDKDITVVNMP